MGDLGDRAPPCRQEDQLGTLVPRVRPPLDVAGPLELIDGLGHRLLAHVGQLGQFEMVAPSGETNGKTLAAEGPMSSKPPAASASSISCW